MREGQLVLASVGTLSLGIPDKCQPCTTSWQEVEGPPIYWACQADKSSKIASCGLQRAARYRSVNDGDPPSRDFLAVSPEKRFCGKSAPGTQRRGSQTVDCRGGRAKEIRGGREKSALR